MASFPSSRSRETSDAGSAIRILTNSATKNPNGVAASGVSPLVLRVFVPASGHMPRAGSLGRWG